MDTDVSWGTRRDSMVAVIRVTVFPFHETIEVKTTGRSWCLGCLGCLGFGMIRWCVFFCWIWLYAIGLLRNETRKLTRAWRMEVWRKACTEALVAISSLELYLSFCFVKSQCQCYFSEGIPVVGSISLSSAQDVLVWNGFFFGDSGSMQTEVNMPSPMPSILAC